MKRMTGGLLVFATMAALGTPELAAQRGPRGMGFGNRGQGPGVEQIMRMRAELELTDDQIQELEAIRQEAVERRGAHQTEMAELMSRLRAGEIEREAVRDAVDARAEAIQEVAEEHRARIEAILTDAQRETLEDVGSRARAFRQGYMQGMRGDRFGRAGGPFGQGMGRPGIQGRRGGFGLGSGGGFFQRPGPPFGPGPTGPTMGFRRGGW